ncbi:similar to Saccharomyces cerevisiae YKR020W VPS51 Component of the GARP (Golgi-associated retrograde protein) complex [Maudiozyma barnettii]|uniref:Similar to Saccharomyces cerevisiae YKR020W VPS51 Component of the GARP (Golgi-associated retrograde protein) complex n=1 Tax=Maudiozyma barnettii TaxID=61262 RepID=A0A8H2VFL6_9SACH|nr:Vps51p [Kazachstania barnettii]CAB4254575.1 similar to Saccharomyces cerevisiae YKR020W VPS51 Component of the GARP (Golgi-associated retrograde protein) complex [Kazachstania barnettii]CAD1782617.1 similar to Saccharomyces cerevisiae YKR020W VPS51 Component of the GARP (Golgi-associated retrograde protein) complex [Kazachstania barnettii]
MAEQISHKRSLGVKRLDEDKKRLLKEYYKLSDETDTTIDNLNENNDETTIRSSSNEEDVVVAASDTETFENNEASTESTEADPDRHINEMTLQQILQIHNRLVGQEIEMSNSIKNTIYDNYYDLVKVNTLLQDIVQRDHATITGNDNRMATLLGQLRTLSEP